MLVGLRLLDRWVTRYPEHEGNFKNGDFPKIGARELQVEDPIANPG